MVARIQVRIDKAYGNTRRYVIDKEQAKWLKQLTGKKTLSDGHVEALQNLGYEVKEVEVLGRRV